MSRLRFILLAAGLLAVASVPPAAVLAAESKPATAPAPRTFSDPHFGLSFKYPGDWREEQPEPFTLILRPPGTDALGFAAVTLRNLHRPADVEPIAGPPAAAAQYIKDLKAGARSVKILTEAPFGWDLHHDSPADKGKKSAAIGHQVVSSFVRDEIPFRQWAVFLPSPLGPVVHAWLYTAPETVFDDGLPAARVILDSLRPQAPPDPPANPPAAAGKGGKGKP